MQIENHLGKPMKAIRSIATALLFSVLCRSAGAMSYVMMRDQDLRTQADGVLVGTIQYAESSSTETRYQLQGVRYLRGAIGAGTETLSLPGAFVGLASESVESTTLAHVAGMPQLARGQKLMLFYRRAADGTVRSMQLLLGLFLEGESGGARWYDRALDQGRSVSDANGAFAALRDAPLFEAWAQGTEVSPEQYLRPGWKELQAPRPKYTLALFQGDPIRWTKFAASQSENWFATQSGMAGATSNVFTSVANAVNVWTNDPSSNIRYSYAGTVASDPGNNSSNGVSAVIFDDPDNDIAGSFNCASGGTLAIGGPFFSLATTPFAGFNFHTAAEGFVITQDGAACFFDGSAGNNGAETLAHEIGHTLGFGHSCGDAASPACVTGSVFDAATMRASAHGDGRGAVLAQDDRDVAFLLYPGTTTDLILRNGFE
jgi:hypothetical protein